MALKKVYGAMKIHFHEKIEIFEIFRRFSIFRVKKHKKMGKYFHLGTFRTLANISTKNQSLRGKLNLAKIAVFGYFFETQILNGISPLSSIGWEKRFSDFLGNQDSIGNGVDTFFENFGFFTIPITQGLQSLIIV